MTYVSATNPDFGFVESNGLPNPITLAFVIGTIIFSVAVYIASLIYNRRKGIDLSMIYKEIRPE